MIQLTATRPTKSDALYILRTAAVLVISAVLLSICSLYYSTHTLGTDLFASYFTRPAIFLLNTVPVILLMAFFYFLFRRLWPAFFITSVLVMLMTWINMFKLAFRDDPLIANDFKLVSEAADMAGNYDIAFTAGMICVCVLIVLITVGMFFFANAKVSSLVVQLAGIALAAGLIAVYIAFFAFNEVVYQHVDDYEEANTLDPTEAYIERGFIFPFLHSIIDTYELEPDGYSVEKAEDILSHYETADIPDDKKVNVIAVMLEAFGDFSDYDEIDWGVYPYYIYKQIESESYHGKLITNIFAGGTVDTERCFITGYADYGNLTKDTPSYARYFKSQGYTVEGAHPSYAWFYDRKNINKALGFDNYYFIENRYSSFNGGDVVYDKEFFEDLYDLYKEGTEDTDDPYFSFSVTYQNHAPYDTTVTDGMLHYVSVAYPDDEEHIADNYFNGVYDTWVQIRKLLKKLRDDEEPAVVVIFGDHNPWLGDDNSVYEAFGLDIDTSEQEGFLNYYETPYLMWANDRAKETLDNDFVGEGPDIGPYYLMNELFKQCGWSGNDYMQYTSSVMKTMPLIHSTGAYMVNGKITKDLSATDQKTIDRYEIVQYYMKYDCAVMK